MQDIVPGGMLLCLAYLACWPCRASCRATHPRLSCPVWGLTASPISRTLLVVASAQP